MLLIDGGDLGCGELLMAVHRQVRDLPAGTDISIATTDPAAAIDIPAWCHLTGHRYRGSAHADQAGPFIVTLVGQAHPVDPRRPWRSIATETAL